MVLITKWDIPHLIFHKGLLRRKIFEKISLNKEKKKGIWLLQKENKKNGQHQNITKYFDYITIVDRLRTVSWSNNSHPTGVVKPIY